MKPTATKRKASNKGVAALSADSERAAQPYDRLEYIATSAYYKAQARGFAAGGECDDWLAAEAEYNAGTAEQRT